jgi:hypothetical protein
VPRPACQCCLSPISVSVMCTSLDRRAGPTPLPTPRRPQAIPHPTAPAYKGCPVTTAPLSFPSHPPLRALLSTRSLPSPLSSASCPRRPIGPLPLRHLHAVVPPFLSPLESSHVPPSSAPFGPRLTSPYPHQAAGPHRHPPQPSELHRLGTPPGVSDENSATPLCPAQPSSLPRGVPVGSATPRLPARPRWPCHRTGHACNTGWHGPAGPLGQANST